MNSKQKASIHFFQAAIAILPLVLGAQIYFSLRPVEPVFIKWLKAIGFEHTIEFMQLNFTDSQILPDWIVFSLPSGLWAFAYSLIILSIWGSYKTILRFFWIATIPVLVFGLEIMQLTNILHGTFSLLDIVFSAIGILVGYIVALKLNKLVI